MIFAFCLINSKDLFFAPIVLMTMAYFKHFLLGPKLFPRLRSEKVFPEGQQAR